MASDVEGGRLEREATTLGMTHPVLRREYFPVVSDSMPEKASRGASSGGRPLKSEQDATFEDFRSHLGKRSLSCIDLGSSKKSNNGPIRLPAINTYNSRPATNGESRSSPYLTRESSRASVRSENGKQDDSVPQLIGTLRNKIKASLPEFRKRFISNDPDSVGNVSREGLQRVVCITTGQFVSTTILNKLLDRIGLSGKQTVGCDEFLGKLFEVTGDLSWLNSHSRTTSTSSAASAASSRSNRSTADRERSFLHDRTFVSIPEETAKNGKLSPIIEKKPEEDVLHSHAHAHAHVHVHEHEHESKPEGPQEVLVKPVSLIGLLSGLGQSDKSLADAAFVEKRKLQEPQEPERLFGLRPADEVQEQIKSIFAKQYDELERLFRELDVFNSGRLSSEMMALLFEQLKVKPRISRDEIEAYLWPQFFLRTKARLDFWEFCRHFMYSKETSSFPNAKRNPPRKGDYDYLIRSLEVNSDTTLVRSSIRNQIDYLYEQLRVRFLRLDPHRTGNITRSEFLQIMRELEPDINEHEVQQLCNRYKTDSSMNTINYQEFLKPFMARRYPNDHSSQQDKMDFLWNHSSPRQREATETVTVRDTEAYHSTRRFIQQNKSKLLLKRNQLNRSFASLDHEASGFLHIVELRTVLRLVADVEVGKDDWFEILNELDTQLSGSIDYRKFISLIDEHKPAQPPSKKKS